MTVEVKTPELHHSIFCIILFLLLKIMQWCVLYNANCTVWCVPNLGVAGVSDSPCQENNKITFGMYIIGL